MTVRSKSAWPVAVKLPPHLVFSRCEKKQNVNTIFSGQNLQVDCDPEGDEEVHREENSPKRFLFLFFFSLAPPALHLNYRSARRANPIGPFMPGNSSP